MATKRFERSEKTKLTNHLLDYSLLEFNYLSLPTPWYFRYTSFTCLILTLSFWIRFSLFIVFPMDPVLALYLGDYALIYSAHNYILSIDQMWLSCASITWFYLYRSNFSPRRQAWYQPLSQVMDGLETENPDQYSRVISLIDVSMKLSLLTGVLFAWFFYLPHQIRITNWFLVLLLEFHAITIALVGYTVVSCAVVFAYLFAFFAFLMGQRFGSLSREIDTHLTTLTSETFNGELRAVLVETNRSLLRTLRTIHEANYFWAEVNSLIFISTFFASILILYTLLFTTLSNILRVCLIMLGIMNYFCGQSVNCLAGVYAHVKFHQCCRSLDRLIHKGTAIGNQDRLKLLASSEYMRDRVLFACFGSLEMNSYNYLLVVIEMAAHLMLVIVNSYR